MAQSRRCRRLEEFFHIAATIDRDEERDPGATTPFSEPEGSNDENDVREIDAVMGEFTVIGLDELGDRKLAAVAVNAAESRSRMSRHLLTRSATRARTGAFSLAQGELDGRP
jgi:hypothetical protein